MSNYWDVLIVIDWFILGYYRWIHIAPLVYDDGGRIDETATRNELTTQIYMGFWSVQCVLLWSRVVSLFQITRSAGPLIRMILNMLSDVAKFGIIAVLFFVGISFAAYYIIGGDLETEPNVRLGPIDSVAFYIYQTLIGQQEWDYVKSYTLDDGTVVFDSVRSTSSPLSTKAAKALNGPGGKPPWAWRAASIS